MGTIIRFRRLKWGAPPVLGRGRGAAHAGNWRSNLGLAVFAFIASAIGYAAIPGIEREPIATAATPRPAPMTAQFALCRSGADTDCVVDGDTFRHGADIIRVADIDTPETRDALCDAERARGEQAKHRLMALLNAGPFTLGAYERDTDRYGRRLRIVMRDGRSVGMILVAEGLARAWDGARHPWC